MSTSVEAAFERYPLRAWTEPSLHCHTEDEERAVRLRHRRLLLLPRALAVGLLALVVACHSAPAETPEAHITAALRSCVASTGAFRSKPVPTDPKALDVVQRSAAQVAIQCAEVKMKSPRSGVCDIENLVCHRVTPDGGLGSRDVSVIDVINASPP